MGSVIPMTRMLGRAYKTVSYVRRISKERRDRNRAAGLCINENKQGTHGAATHGCRCFGCYEVHRGKKVG